MMILPERAIFFVYFTIVFMQSTFISIATLSHLSWILLFLLYARSHLSRWHLWFFAAVVLFAGFFVSVAESRGIETWEAEKAAFGFFLFHSTIVALPSVLFRFRKDIRKAAQVAYVIFGGAFVLEYFGVFSFKEAGIVSWYLIHDLPAAFFDDRPSGLLGEPSWFVLTLQIITRIILVTEGQKLPYLGVTLVLVILSNSSTGVAMVGLLFLVWLLDREKTAESGIHWSFADGRASKTVDQGSKLVRGVLRSFVIVMMFSILIFLVDEDVIGKIADPLAYASGVSRFGQPLPFIELTIATHPLTGLGIAYITDFMVGRMGAAVLPSNVFIELGLVGLVFYLTVIAFLIFYFRTRLIDIALCVMLLITLGLPYAPFQAAMLAIVICADRLGDLTNRVGSKNEHSVPAPL